jgi:hypothetical protein
LTKSLCVADDRLVPQSGHSSQQGFQRNHPGTTLSFTSVPT